MFFFLLITYIFIINKIIVIINKIKNCIKLSEILIIIQFKTCIKPVEYYSKDVYYLFKKLNNF